MDDAIIFVRGWTGLSASRAIAIFLSLLILTKLYGAVRRKQVSFLPGFFWFTGGVSMLTIALVPGVVDVLMQVEPLTRVRLLSGVLSLIVLVITVESLRQTQMLERYALLWVITGVIILVFAVYPGIGVVVSRLTGLSYADAVVAILFSFFVLVIFHFSIALSAAHNKQARVIQRLAILEHRVDALDGASLCEAPSNASTRCSRIASRWITRACLL